MYRVCSFAAGQLIVDAQAQAYTCEHLLPHSVRFTRPTVRVWITVCRSTLSQHNRRKDGFHFNERNCFSLELILLKAEIINAVDMKRKTKAQIYRSYKYNIKMFAWNTLYLLERQRSHETQSKGPWYTVVTSAIKIVISIQVSQRNAIWARHCMTSAAVFIDPLTSAFSGTMLCSLIGCRFSTTSEVAG